MPAIGYHVSSRISVGLQYQYYKEKIDQNSINTYNFGNSEQMFININTQSINKINYFGTFVRYYVKDRASKFNAFLNFNPSFISRENKVNAFSTNNYNQFGSGFSSVSSSSLDQSNPQGYDLDLGLGISYRLIKGLSVQAHLRSLFNANKNVSGFEVIKYSVLKDPWKNTCVALNYQF